MYVRVYANGAAGRGADGMTIVRKRWGLKGAGCGMSGQAEPKGGWVERNVGKGRKEWRHFAEVDEKRERSSNHTDNEVTMGNPDVGAGPLV